MGSRAQHSKRDRGREHEGLPPKQTAEKKTCPECGESYYSAGAHAEECYGRPVREDFTGWYAIGGLCGCGWRRDGGRCVHGNPYVPVMKPRSNANDHEGAWKEPTKR